MAKNEPEIERNALIGEKVRFYRTTRNISMQKLCESLSTIQITHQNLARYETNQARWPADLLCEIAIVLGLDINVLVGFDKQKRDATDNDEWEAERHKILLMQLPEKGRKVVYNLIQGMINFMEGCRGK